MKMRRHEPSPAARGFRNDVIVVLRKYADNLGAMGMLAVTAHLVGQLVAMQDQRKMTSAQAMELVASNIEVGNASVVNGLANPLGGAQ